MAAQRAVRKVYLGPRMLRRILSIAIIVLAVAIVLPIPLALLVDMTFHWLLLITLPIGVPILGGLVLWRLILGRAPHVPTSSGEASTPNSDQAGHRGP